MFFNKSEEESPVKKPEEQSPPRSVRITPDMDAETINKALEEAGIDYPITPEDAAAHPLGFIITRVDPDDRLVNFQFREYENLIKDSDMPERYKERLLQELRLLKSSPTPEEKVRFLFY